jgi:hypothetical protein
MFATLLKNKFGHHSKFFIQNVAAYSIEMEALIYNADSPSDPPISIERNISPGATIHFDMNAQGTIAASSFNGSAIVYAYKQNTSYPAPIVGGVLELSISGVTAVAFEGISRGFNKVFSIYSASGCNALAGARSFQADR